ncbi:Lectin-domain containing receptor kinase A4.3 [Hordeum vulgare]|nr:Lectin-domain containing receptor kinase A4.3 [Hordeum vulgare]
MDNDLASSGITIAPSRKGKPRAPRKTSTSSKKKKELTPKKSPEARDGGKGRRSSLHGLSLCRAVGGYRRPCCGGNEGGAIVPRVKPLLAWARQCRRGRGQHWLVYDSSDDPARVASRVSDSTDSRLPRLPASLPTLWGMVAEGCLMQDQVGLDLDGFPLDHLFPDDYNLEEEDEVDINGEPLFEDELDNQAPGMHPKRKSGRTKAYKAVEDKLLCEYRRDIGQHPKVFQQECNKLCATYESIKARPMSDIGMQDMAFRVQHEGKSFHLSHCLRIIKDEEKFRAQYATLMARGGGEKAVEEVGEGGKPRPWEKTNSKKEDKWDATSIALNATVEGMMTKKDSREEKRQQEKKDQMNAFMEIQRRMLEMEAEKQARMLEIEAEK